MHDVKWRIQESFCRIIVQGMAMLFWRFSTTSSGNYCHKRKIISHVSLSSPKNYRSVDDCHFILFYTLRYNCQAGKSCQIQVRPLLLLFPPAGTKCSCVPVKPVVTFYSSFFKVIIFAPNQYLTRVSGSHKMYLCPTNIFLMHKILIPRSGDFNLVMDPKMDRLDSNHNHVNSHAVLQEYIERAQLVDIWRLRNPDKKIFTWCRDGVVRNRRSASRIDMLLVSQAYADCVHDCSISFGHRSDHSLVLMDICLDKYKRGPGTWKLNNKLLENEEYIKQINQVIKNTIEDNPHVDPNVRWTMLKTNCVNHSKKFARREACKLRNEIDNLRDLKAILTQDCERNPDCQYASNSLNQINLKINQIDLMKTEQSIFRSRCNWLEFGEKNSKMFFSLEKRNYMDKNMKHVITECGRHITDQKGILEEQTKFYKSLYTKDSKVNFNLKRNKDEKYLSEEGRLACDAELSIDELYDAVMTLKSNKCPGGDGLTNEFYRKFFKLLSISLLQMAKYSFETGLLPRSTRRGIISLLSKPNKDSRYVKNKRPLTLQNSDCKIIAKALDNRLRTYLPEIIDPAQTGFLKGRNIACNLRKSIDLIEYTKNSNTPAMILSVDMEKCFDKIDYTAIFGALRYFNFGETFIKWVRLFFNDYQVCTQNFGYLSEFFSKGRSVNQGCVISPSLFLLTSEILANKLRNNPKIRGIKVHETEILLSQFADDMDLYLPYNVTVLNQV